MTASNQSDAMLLYVNDARQDHHQKQYTCRYDGQPIDSWHLPFRLPKEYNTFAKDFIFDDACLEMFCSPNCAEAYLRKYFHGEYLETRLKVLRRFLLQNFQLPQDLTICAPPIECLTTFGGSLTLKQFRNITTVSKVNCYFERSENNKI
jgi:hypothetical protein